MARIRVDLSAEPIASEVRKRYDLLAQIADEMLRGGTLDPAEIALDEEHLARVVEGYYLMSEAYKWDKLKHSVAAPKLTEPSKKAAFTALSIMTFRPLRRLDPMRELHHELSPVANETLIMEAAGTFMSREFLQLGWEMQRRLFRWLDCVGVRCLSGYINDQSDGLLRPVYEIDLDDDLAVIDAAILIFESPLR